MTSLRWELFRIVVKCRQCCGWRDGLGRGGCEHEFFLERLRQQGEMPVVLDAPELLLHPPERGGTPTQLLSAGPPVADAMGPRFEAAHHALDEVRGLEAHA